MDIIFEIFGLKSELVYIWTTFTLLLTLVKLGRFFFLGRVSKKGLNPFLFYTKEMVENFTVKVE